MERFIKTEAGTFDVMICSDAGFTGVDVEFLPDNEKKDNASLPRITFEYEADAKELHAYIWDNPEREDYSQKLIFDLRKYCE